jgi:MFS transporter, DHA2 family, multidrug resistance protein
MDTKPRDLRSTRGIDMQVLAGLAVVNQKITRQAAMIAYVDDFVLMLVATIVVAPLILLIRPPKKSGGEQVHVAME